MSSTRTDLPDTLTLEEAFRATVYMILQYIGLENNPDESLVVLAQYLWTDPARWNDWKSAVDYALSDEGLANPDHDGQ
jgi:hypothetical protein